VLLVHSSTDERTLDDKELDAELQHAENKKNALHVPPAHNVLKNQEREAENANEWFHEKKLEKKD